MVYMYEICNECQDIRCCIPTVPAATNCRYLPRKSSCFQLRIFQDGFLRVINGGMGSLQMALKMGIPGAIAPTYRAITGRGPSCTLVSCTLVDCRMSRLWLLCALQQQHCPEGQKKKRGRLRWKFSRLTTVDSTISKESRCS